MTKYRLNNAETRTVAINHVAKTKMINGRPIVTYSNYIRLIPGEVYQTDDEAMLSFFRQYKVKIRYTAEAERALQEAGVPYDTELCPTCGGRIKKLVYRQVEVLDE